MKEKHPERVLPEGDCLTTGFHTEQQDVNKLKGWKAQPEHSG